MLTPARRTPELPGRVERGGSATGPMIMVLAAIALLGLLLFVLLRDGSDAGAAAGPAGIGPGDGGASAAALAAPPAPGAAQLAAALSAERSGLAAAGVRLRGPARLEGRVLERGSGAGVGGARVELLVVPPAGAAFLGRVLRVIGSGELAPRLRPVAIAASAADGRFVFEGVRSGSYFVDARGEWHVPENVVRARLLPSGAGGPIEVWVRPGGRVLGRVLRPDGEPAPEAKLALIAGPGAVITSARTGDLRFLETVADEAGRFVFPGVPPGAGYEITASCAGFALSHALGIDVRAGEDTLCDVRLRAGGSITGRVVERDERGEPRPLAGAHLGAVPRGLRNLRCVEEILLATHCESGPDGRFLMPNVPPGEVDLIAITPQHLPAIGARVALSEGALVEADEIVLRRGALVRGKVVDSAGAAVPGVALRWNLVDWRNFQFDLSFAPLMAQAVKGFELPKTDAEGRFEASPIAGEAPWTVTFAKPGFVELEHKFEAQAADAEQVVVLQRGAAVEGLVMDGQLAVPVTSFTISGADRLELDPDAPPFQAVFGDGQLVEDEGGRFRVESVAPGESTLTFSAPGFLSRSVDVAVTEGQVKRGLIVTLMPGGIVRGRVLDKEGRGIAGAQVLAQSAPGEARGGRPLRAQRERMRERRQRGGTGPFGGGGDQPLPPGMTAFAMSMGLLGDRGVVSDAQGAFELPGVEPGAFRVAAFHRQYCAATSEPLTMGDDGRVEGLTLVLSGGGTIEGTVSDRFGRPVPDEIVVAFSPQGFAPGGSAGGGMFQGATDELGRYRIEHVAPGSYFLVATRGDEELNPMSFFGSLNLDLVTVPADTTVHFDLVDSTAAGVRVHGTITHKGEPIERGQLVAITYDTDNMLGVEFRAARMQGEGRYEFPGLAPGEYQLNLDGNGPQVRLELDVPDVPEFRADLELPESGLEGRVVDDATDEALEGAELSLRPQRRIAAGGLLGGLISGEGRDRQAKSGADGAFAFERLSEGEYELLARAPRRDGRRGFAPSDPLVVRVDRRRVTHGVVVRLLPALSLAGRVVDERGQPVVQAEVFVSPQPGGTDVRERARSDAQGRFDVSGLAPGVYRAVASAEGFAQGQAENLALVRGRPAPACEIVMVRGTLVRVRVLGPDGAPLAGAIARLESQQGAPAALDPAAASRVLESLFGGGGGAGTSDAEGLLELGRFRAGEYRLSVQRGVQRTERPDVKVDAGREELELTVRLD